MVGEHAKWSFLSSTFFSLAPNITVTLTPPVINDSATNVAINLNCTATVEESIILDEYQFVWMFNGMPIDQSDERINVCMVIYLSDVVSNNVVVY